MPSESTATEAEAAAHAASLTRASQHRPAEPLRWPQHFHRQAAFSHTEEMTHEMRQAVAEATARNEEM